MIFATTLTFGGAHLSGSLIFAAICALLAATKGRSAITWGVLGFFLQCFALVFVLFADDVNESAENETNRTHRRRTNERLKKESHKINKLASEVRGRLDAHDMAIGLDTREIKRPLARSTPNSMPSGEPCWFYEDDGQTAGPITERSLLALIHAGMVESTTLIWRDGMLQWTPLSAVKDLKA